MKWVRFEWHGIERFGALDGDHVALHEGTPYGVPAPTGERIAVTDVAHWLPPCEPKTIVGLWNNFGALADKNGWGRPAEALYFLKSVSSLAGHGWPIAEPPAGTGRVSYEGELAVVIGRTARAVSVAEAEACILGYTCANDVTAIELLHRDPSFPQWTRAKSFDGFCVLGPCIDTGFRWADAAVRTRVGGRERQRYPLADMIFGPAELVSRLSHDMTLQPGDVILCGTSLGVLPMKPGTAVEVEINGIGVLSNVYG